MMTRILPALFVVACAQGTAPGANGDGPANPATHNGSSARGSADLSLVGSASFIGAFDGIEDDEIDDGGTGTVPPDDEGDGLLDELIDVFGDDMDSPHQVDGSLAGMGSLSTEVVVIGDGAIVETEDPDCEGTLDGSVTAFYDGMLEVDENGFYAQGFTVSEAMLEGTDCEGGEVRFDRVQAVGVTVWLEANEQTCDWMCEGAAENAALLECMASEDALSCLTVVEASAWATCQQDCTDTGTSWILAESWIEADVGGSLASSGEDGLGELQVDLIFDSLVDVDGETHEPMTQ